MLTADSSALRTAQTEALLLELLYRQLEMRALCASAFLHL
jgi:hypothetical protein